jgi:CRISPR/Cas system endoribonuclease Cas6 (RAMP superfamily)
MRIIIRFTKNLEPVSYINQHLVNNYIYGKCLKNDRKYHDEKSNYCISGLYGGKKNNDMLDFPNGAMIVVTSQDSEFITKVMLGAMNNKEFAHGMIFHTIDSVDEKFDNICNHFATLSPFIFKEYTDDGYKFVVFNDEKFLNKNKKIINKLNILDIDVFSKYITDRIKNKLIKINPELDLAKFKIVAKHHDKHKIKKILIRHENIKNDVSNYANQLQIDIYCNKNVADMIYNLGIGQSTGCGFGTIIKTENLYKYQV